MAILEDTLTNMISPELVAWRAKPATVDTSFTTTDSMDRVNAGARLRGSNTVATLDENGRTVITGSGSPSSDVPTSQPGAPASTAFDIGTASAKLQVSSTAEDKLTTAQQLSGSLAAYESKTHLDAINAANQKYGIAGLEATVKKEQQVDADFLLTKPDSPRRVSDITIRAQQQLEQARSDAAKEAQNSILTNPEYARISTEGKALIQKAGALASSQLNKETTMDMRNAELADMLTPSVKSATLAMQPELAGQPDHVIFKQMQNSPHKDIILNADNPDVLKTFLTDPKHAEKMAGTETLLRNRVGDDEVAKSKITGEIQQFKTFSADPKKAIARMYPNPEEQKKKLQELSTLMLDHAANKPIIDAMTKEAADTAMKVEVNQKFKDLNTWTPSTLAVLNANPIMSGVLNTVLAKNNGRKEALNFDNIALEMTKLQPKDLAIAKELMIQQAAGESKARSKGSLWPTLGEEDIRRNFSLSATAPYIAQDEATLASMIGRIWDYSAAGLQYGTAALLEPFALAGSTAAAVLETPLSGIDSGIATRITDSAKTGVRSLTGTPILEQGKLRGSNK